MSSSFRVYKHMWIEKKLSDFELQGLCGALAYNIPFEGKMKPWQFVKPVPERRFKIGKVPQSQIIKFGKKEHVDEFFRTGSLQLGSFKYYSSFEHSEIGDNEEGVATLIAKTPFGATGGKYGSGYNNLIFCTYLGNADDATMKKFGYDSGFLITDPKAFASAIAHSLGTNSYFYGKCIYRRIKAVLGFPGNDVERHTLSRKSGEIVQAAKYLIKPAQYSHQQEFRFLWEQPEDISGTKIIDASEARRFCKRLKP